MNTMFFTLTGTYRGLPFQKHFLIDISDYKKDLSPSYGHRNTRAYLWKEMHSVLSSSTLLIACSAIMQVPLLTYCTDEWLIINTTHYGGTICGCFHRTSLMTWPWRGVIGSSHKWFSPIHVHCARLCSEVVSLSACRGRESYTCMNMVAANVEKGADEQERGIFIKWCVVTGRKNKHKTSVCYSKWMHMVALISQLISTTSGVGHTVLPHGKQRKLQEHALSPITRELYLSHMHSYTIMYKHECTNKPDNVILWNDTLCSFLWIPMEAM